MRNIFLKIEVRLRKCFLYNLQASDVIVGIENGQVRGQLNATVDANTPYYAFRGIPYAQPPIGDLRFRVR